MSDFSLSDTRALVVGASRGIGRGVAEAFADAGASVALAARSTDALEDLAAQLPGEVLPLACDVRDTASVDACVEEAVASFGGLEAAVVSAGTIARGPVTEATDEDFERVVDVNLVGSMRVARASLPHLAAGERGALVFISSEVGERGIPDLPVYTASKGGQNALTRQLAIQHADEGVTVNAIAPGTTKTSINEEVRREDPTWVDERSEQIPMGRLGEPEDVAAVATLLAAEAGDYITGEVIAVDGGTTAR